MKLSASKVQQQVRVQGARHAAGAPSKERGRRQVGQELQLPQRRAVARVGTMSQWLTLEVSYSIKANGCSTIASDLQS